VILAHGLVEGFDQKHSTAKYAKGAKEKQGKAEKTAHWRGENHSPQGHDLLLLNIFGFPAFGFGSRLFIFTFVFP